MKKIGKKFEYDGAFALLSFRQWKNHPGLKKYSRNMGWMFLGQVISLLTSFFIGAWLTRYLGPSRFGILSYALSFGALFGFATNIVADSILNRELIKNPGNQNALLGTAFVMKMVGGLAAMIITVVAAFLAERSSLNRELIIIYSLAFLLPAISLPGVYFQASVQAKKTVSAQFFSALVSSILKVAIILSGYGVISVMVIYMLDGLWSAIILLLAYSREGFKFSHWAFDGLLAQYLLRNSAYLLFSAAIWLIYVRIDQILIRHMLGVNDVGYYAAAVKISEIWNFLPGVICASLFPAIVNSKTVNEHQYRRRLRYLYWLLAGLAVAVALPITVFAEYIIIMLFGQSFLVAVPILKIYVWSGLGMFLNVGATQFLITENMVRSTLALTVFGTLANVLLNIYLIRLAGLNGAAWASVISYLLIPVSVLLFSSYLKRQLD